MKHLKILTLSLLLFCSIAMSAQVTMIGNSEHNFNYKEKPLKTIKGIAWQFKTEGVAAYTPLVVNGVIYSGDDKGFLYAIDCESGKEIWRFSAGSKLYDGPNINNKTAYFGTAGGAIFAVDISTGLEKWKIQTKGSVCTAPAIKDSLGYALSHDKKMYVFNIETGRIKDTIQESYILCGTPTIANNKVYYPDWGGNIHCRGIDSEKEIWSYSTGIPSKWFTSPSISDSVANFVNYDSTLHVLQAKDGKETWNFKADGKISRAPSISDNLIVFTTTDSHVYAVNRNKGNLQWDFKSNGTSWSFPFIVEDVVYYGSGNGKIYAFDLNTGSILWDYTFEKPVNTPSLKNGKVYCTSGNYIISIK